VARGQEAVPPPFTATASALGSQLLVRVPGFIGTDVPFDGGGPTAQVQLDSLGTSKGYAAMPDPGSLVVTLPGLVTGLLAQGAGGLPPLPIPSLPAYPLSVTSDVNLTPEAAVGSGPYSLRARSAPDVGSATAIAGLEASPLGNVAMVRAESSVVVDGATVTATAANDVEGLSIGPLTLGRVRSHATVIVDESGVAKPSSELQIDGASIGGLPIRIDGDSIDLLGSLEIPVPVARIVNDLLHGAGITVELLAAEQTDTSATAGAVRISMPFGPIDIPNVGSFTGTLAVTLGAASANITAAVEDASGVEEGAANPGVGSTASSLDVGDLGGLNAVTSVGDVDASVVAPAPVRAGLPTGGAIARLGEVRGLFDLSSIYLMMVGCGVALAVTGHVIRRVAVRTPPIREER
jgi:hypothetical protein